jgi:hypothetical protein
MGKWGQATFFRTGNLDALERAIRDLCRDLCLEEGLVAAPSGSLLVGPLLEELWWNATR